MDDSNSSLNPNATSFIPNSNNTSDGSNIQYIYFQPLTESNYAGHQLPATNLCGVSNTNTSDASSSS